MFPSARDKKILLACERGFPAVNFLNLATLLPESNLGVNPPIQNAELHAPLRIIPETFEAALLSELRLSL
jgi:hypothetical protein